MTDRRVPPHDKEAEKALIGIAVLDNAQIPSLIPLVDPENFYSDKCRALWEGVITLACDNKEVSIPSLHAHLAGKMTMEEVSKVIDGVPKSSDAKYYAGIVREKSKMRKVIEAAMKLAEAAHDGDTDSIAGLIADLGSKKITGKREHTLAEEIRSWVGITNGNFSVTDVFNSLQGVTQKDRPNIRVALHRLKSDGVIEPSGGRDGVYRRVERELEVMDFLNAPTEGLTFDWPLDLHEICTIFPKDIVCFAGAQNAGKGHPDGTQILTPAGWANIESLSVGDTVIAQDGSETKLNGVFRRGPQQCFKFTFNDRTSIVCDWEHLWAVKGRYQRNIKTGRGTENRSFNEWQTIPTYNLIGRYIGPSALKSSQHLIIPAPSPVMFKKRSVPLDPYVLGALLGDGCFKKGATVITTTDTEIVKKIEDCGIGVGAVNRGINYNLLGLMPTVKTLGLNGHRSWEKFVPSAYLLNDKDVRLGILRGLMDTDGDISKSGKSLSYTSTSQQLSDDVAFLVRSLGGRATIANSRRTKYGYNGEKKLGRQSWRVHISMPENPFWIKRKADRYAPFLKNQNKCLRSIESVGIQETTCLSVDHPSGLYVAQGFIVTHNTALAVDFIRRNQDKWDIHYFNCEMSASRLRDRLSKVDDMPLDAWKFKPYTRSDDFADVIQPNAVNIVDYLEIVDNYWEVAKKLKDIHKKLDQGIAIVLLQKDEFRDTGRGGTMSLEKPVLYVALNHGKAKIVKAKSWKGAENPNKKIVEFKLVHGWKFVPQGHWHSEEAGETMDRALGKTKFRLR